MSTPPRQHHRLPAARTLGFLSAAGLLALGACSVDMFEESEPTVASSQGALIGGAVDLEDPGVVALVTSSGSNFCTGTLVSPSVILTAAHCIDELGTFPNANIYFGPDSNGNEGNRYVVRTKKQHPMWDGELNGTFDYDIGMLVMDFPAADPTVAQKLNTSSPAADHIGEPYRHVGFGVYDFDGSNGLADGKKRTGINTISSTRDDVIISGNADVRVCFGDSGGPAFLTIDGEEVVAGVHSYTNGSGCNPPNGDTNVQMYANDFIIPWIQDNDPSCGLDGVCGAIGCIDDPDCAPCGPDGTCVEDCELPDPDCSTQLLGEICRANTQCQSDVCAAYRGDPDYKFCTESCDPSNDSCPDGMSCQEIIPLGNICYYDDDPAGILGDSCDAPAECGSYKCADSVCVVSCDLSVGLNCPENFECNTRDEGANYYCFGLPKDEGGCRVAGQRGGAGFALILLGLCLAFRRRRS